MIILVVNMIALVPIILSVGCLSMYQYYCLLYNTSTIESWEKEKVATMIRRGKIREVRSCHALDKTKRTKGAVSVNPFLVKCIGGADEYRGKIIRPSGPISVRSGDHPQYQLCLWSQSAALAMATGDACGRVVFPGLR